MDQFNTGKQLVPAVPTDPGAIAAAEGAKARIQAAYIMALQKPRSEDQARARILKACRRPVFAAKVQYSKRIGRRPITGPSIRFAELALREWGNILTDSQTIFEDEKVRRVRITCCDLETNASFSKDVTIKKTVERKDSTGREVVGERTNREGEVIYIVEATDEELVNKESALISKALRNEGLRIIPTDIVEDSLAAARKTLADKASKDPDAAKKLVLDSFSSIGILPKHLEEYLKHSMDTISPKELEDLRGIYQAIRDGEASWADFKNEKEGQDPGPGSSTQTTAPATQNQSQDPGPESEASPEQETEPSQESQPEESEQKLYGQLRDKAMQEKNWQEDLDAAEKGQSLLYKFIEHVAQDKNVAVNYVLQEALSSFEGFWQHFEPWRIKEIEAQPEPPESQPEKSETSQKGRPPSPDTIIKKLTEKKAPEDTIDIAGQAFKEATPEELRDIYQAVSKEIPNLIPLENLVERLGLWPDKDKEQDKPDPPKKDGLFL